MGVPTCEGPGWSLANGKPLSLSATRGHAVEEEPGSRGQVSP